MKFLIDNQLPLALSRFLVDRGHESVHVLEVGLHDADDRTILKFATTEGRVLVSKDEDFFHLAIQPDAQVSLVWVRLSNCRNQVLLKAFEDALAGIVSTVESGQRIVELRS